MHKTSVISNSQPTISMHCTTQVKIQQCQYQVDDKSLQENEHIGSRKQNEHIEA